jgi:hypothetical protein
LLSKEDSYYLFVEKLPSNDIFDKLKDFVEINELHDYTEELFNDGKMFQYNYLDLIPC